MTAELFAPLHDELLTVLRGLAPADWDRPTLARAWRVRDVAAHLLDTQLRKLSAQRDGHLPPPDREIAGTGDLVAFLNGLNASWIAAARRLSPRVLVDLLAAIGPAVAALVESQDPEAEALFPVSWAGESRSAVWFDTGREYTEWWHHQMQIRDAVGAPLLLERRWLHPLLDLSARAFPPAFAGVAAPAGTAAAFEVTGEAGGVWSVVRGAGAWALFRGAPEVRAVTVRTDPDTSWRLLYNALTPEELKERVGVEGDAALAAPLLKTRSVMV